MTKLESRFIFLQRSILFALTQCLINGTCSRFTSQILYATITDPTHDNRPFLRWGPMTGVLKTAHITLQIIFHRHL